MEKIKEKKQKTAKASEEKSLVCTEEKPCFQHISHLVENTNQECLQCHRSQKAGTYSTLFPCISCHIEEKEIKVEFTREIRSVLFASFNHIPHLKNQEACIDCHNFSQSMTVSFESCKPCHKEHNLDLERYQEQNCQECHKNKKILAQPRSISSFLHSSHTSSNFSNKECLFCHENLFQKSQKEYISWEKCSECHPKIASTYLWKKETKEKQENFVFSHEQHLANGETCFLCHKIKEGKVLFRVEHDSLYEKCLSCHPSWRTKEHGTGKICWKCHNPKEKLHQASLVLVERKKWKSLQLESLSNKPSTHHTMEDECKKCHLKEKRKEIYFKKTKFPHKKHLDTNISAKEIKQQCLLCHPNVENSKSDSLSIFSQKEVCQKCHREQKITYLEEKTSYLRPLFHHNQHREIKEGCISCHTLNTGNITTKMDCKHCHNHKEQKDTVLLELNQCFFCHTEEKIWEKKTKKNIDRVSIDKLTYEHKKTGKCLLCHIDSFSKKERDTIKKIFYKNSPHPITISQDTCQNCHPKMRQQK